MKRHSGSSGCNFSLGVRPPSFVARSLLPRRSAKAVFASLAEEFGGSTKVVRGEELLKEGDSYPMVRQRREREREQEGRFERILISLETQDQAGVVFARCFHQRSLFFTRFSPLPFLYFARYDLARPHIFYEKVVFFRISTLFQVHAVGRAAGAGREPRLLDLTWAPAGTDAESLPKVMTTRTSEKTRTGTYGVAWYRKQIHLQSFPSVLPCSSGVRGRETPARQPERQTRRGTPLAVGMVACGSTALGCSIRGVADGLSICELLSFPPDRTMIGDRFGLWIHRVSV